MGGKEIQQVVGGSGSGNSKMCSSSFFFNLSHKPSSKWKTDAIFELTRLKTLMWQEINENTTLASQMRIFYLPAKYNVKFSGLQELAPHHPPQALKWWNFPFFPSPHNKLCTQFHMKRNESVLIEKWVRSTFLHVVGPGNVGTLCLTTGG